MATFAKKQRRRAIKARRSQLTFEALEQRNLFAAAPGLVGAWAFNETSGTTVVDSSGNGLNGAISGATRTTSGKFGGALSFDGTNDWVTITDSNNLDLTAGMTLEAWVRPSTVNGWETVVIKERPDGLAYGLYGSDPWDGSPAGWVRRTGATNYSIANGTGGALALNAWSHVAATYDGSTIRVYVNGGMVSSQAATGTITTSADPLRIGGNSEWGEYFAGIIDEVRVYNRALTASEIQADMNSPIGGGENPTQPTNQAGLVAGWGFEEASGTTIVDSSGNGINGTITGATWSTSGKYGGALLFDGVNDYVTINDTNQLDLTNGMTLEAWVNPTAASGVRDILIKEGTGVDIYNLYHRNGGGLPESNAYINGSNRSAVGSALPLNTWTHLAGTYDGSVLRLYVNGTVISSTNIAGSIPTSTGALRIGGNSLWGEYFAGLIDEVRIYNRALTSSEIQADMNTPVSAQRVTHRWAPMVYAGADSTVNFGTSATVNGEVIANRPQGLTIAWTKISGPGTVTFGNANSPSTTASFSQPGVYELQLRATNTYGATTDRVVIDVRSNNQDEVLATNSPLTLAEGATSTITSARLRTTDADNTPAQLIYTITAVPANGNVRLSGANTTTFTQADIDAGLVTYRHNGNETTSDSFTFRVNDLEGFGTTGTFNITVTAVNDEQVLSTNSQLTVAPAASAGITSSHLRATDADNTTAQLTYTITAGPTRGTLRRSGVATTSFTQADIDAGRITYQHNGSATTSDSFSFTVNDGQGSSTSGTFSISIVSSTPGNTDSFEAGGTSGWDDNMWEPTGNAGTATSGLETGAFVSPPPGGGANVLRQWWRSDVDSGWAPEWLVYDFSTDVREHDVFELEYYIYYDPNFNPGPDEVVKSIILQSTSGTDDRIYIDTHHFGPAAVYLQGTAGAWEDRHLSSNINGAAYDLPHGQWVQLRWQIKLSAQNGSTPDTGYIYGWVNGVKRWQYDNVSTHGSGNITNFSLSATINQGSLGANQKRYWDSFTVRTGAAVSGQAMASASVLDTAAFASGGYAESEFANPRSLSFSPLRRALIEDAVSSAAVESTSSANNELLTIVEQISSRLSFQDDVLSADNETDLVFEHFGESGLGFDESWSDPF